MAARFDDERLAEWVDDRLDDRQLERLEADFAADAELASGATRYRQLVTSLRAELQIDVGRPSAELTDRIMASISAAPPVSARWRWRSVIASAAAAAALVLGYLGIRELGDPPAEETSSARQAETAAPVVVDLLGGEQDREAEAKAQDQLLSAMRPESSKNAANREERPVQQPTHREDRTVPPVGGRRVVDRQARARSSADAPPKPVEVEANEAKPALGAEPGGPALPGPDSRGASAGGATPNVLVCEIPHTFGDATTDLDAAVTPLNLTRSELSGWVDKAARVAQRPSRDLAVANDVAVEVVPLPGVARAGAAELLKREADDANRIGWFEPRFLDRYFELKGDPSQLDRYRQLLGTFARTNGGSVSVQRATPEWSSAIDAPVDLDAQVATAEELRRALGRYGLPPQEGKATGPGTTGPEATQRGSERLRGRVNFGRPGAGGGGRLQQQERWILVLRSAPVPAKKK